MEHKDASPEERAILEINSGVYAFDIAVSARCATSDRRMLRVSITCRPGEDYRARALPVEALTLEDPREIAGVNGRKELANVVIRRPPRMTN